MDEIEDLESRSNLGEKVYPPWEQEIIKEFNFKQIEELIGNKHLVSSGNGSTRISKQGLIVI